MRTLVRLLCMASLIVVSAFGQRGGGHGGGGGMHGGGFGGMRGGGFGMHGGGMQGGFGHGFRGPVGVSPGFHNFGVAPRPFGFNRGFAPGFRSPAFRDGRFFRDGRSFDGRFFRDGRFFDGRFFDGRFFRGNTFAFGLGFGFPFGGGFGFPFGGGFWGWPGGFGGGYPYPVYGGDYNGAYTPSPNVTVIYPPSTGSDYYGSSDTGAPAEPAPSAVINEYNWGSSANVGTPQKTTYFSIALRDNSVIDAVAYWVDGNTLHYIDKQGKEKQVQVSQVDEARSQQLNSERGIEFGLPKSG